MKALVVSALLLFGIAQPAFAQSGACGPLTKELSALASHYGETIVWAGRVENHELYVTQSPEHHTWTLIGVTFTLAGAVGCILQSGTHGALMADPANNGSVFFLVPKGRHE